MVGAKTGRGPTRISDLPQLVSRLNNLAGEALRFLAHAIDIRFALKGARVGYFLSRWRIAQCQWGHRARPAAVSPLNTIIHADNVGWPVGLSVCPPFGRGSNFTEFLVSLFDLAENSLILLSEMREVRLGLHGPIDS
jgi:hypothetical protein